MLCGGFLGLSGDKLGGVLEQWGRDRLQREGRPRNVYRGTVGWVSLDSVYVCVCVCQSLEVSCNGGPGRGGWAVTLCFPSAALSPRPLASGEGVGHIELAGAPAPALRAPPFCGGCPGLW